MSRTNANGVNPNRINTLLDMIPLKKKGETYVRNTNSEVNVNLITQTIKNTFKPTEEDNVEDLRKQGSVIFEAFMKLKEDDYKEEDYWLLSKEEYNKQFILDAMLNTESLGNFIEQSKSKNESETIILKKFMNIAWIYQIYNYDMFISFVYPVFLYIQQTLQQQVQIVGSTETQQKGGIDLVLFEKIKRKVQIFFDIIVTIPLSFCFYLVTDFIEAGEGLGEAFEKTINEGHMENDINQVNSIHVLKQFFKHILILFSFIEDDDPKYQQDISLLNLLQLSESSHFATDENENIVLRKTPIFKILRRQQGSNTIVIPKNDILYIIYMIRNLARVNMQLRDSSSLAASPTLAQTKTQIDILLKDNDTISDIIQDFVFLLIQAKHIINSKEFNLHCSNNKFSEATVMIQQNLQMPNMFKITIKEESPHKHYTVEICLKLSQENTSTPNFTQIYWIDRHITDVYSRTFFADKDIEMIKHVLIFFNVMKLLNQKGDVKQAKIVEKIIMLLLELNFQLVQKILTTILSNESSEESTNASRDVSEESTIASRDVSEETKTKTEFLNMMLTFAKRPLVLSSQKINIDGIIQAKNINDIFQALTELPKPKTLRTHVQNTPLKKPPFHTGGRVSEVFVQIKGTNIIRKVYLSKQGRKYIILRKQHVQLMDIPGKYVYVMSK